MEQNVIRSHTSEQRNTHSIKVFPNDGKSNVGKVITSGMKNKEVKSEVKKSFRTESHDPVSLLDLLDKL